LTVKDLGVKNLPVHSDAEFRWAPGFDQPMDEWSTPRLVGVASRLVGAVGIRIADRHGVSPAGFFLLRALQAEDGLSAGEAARRCWMSPAMTTSVVDALEKDGHLQRRRDAPDRRVVRLYLTDTGRKEAEQAQNHFAVDMAKMYDFVDPADEPAVRRFLVGLIERFSAALKGDLP